MNADKPQPDGNGGIMYKDYFIRNSDGGGKAGKGKNRTATLQVHEPVTGGSLLKAQFKYRMSDRASFDAALDKCFEWVNQHPH